MTLKAFSDKYHIPYSKVFAFSFAVRPRPTEDREKDFPEKELVAVAQDYYEHEILSYTLLIESYREILNNLQKGVEPKC